jgi:hypothetical protein
MSKGGRLGSSILCVPIVYCIHFFSGLRILSHYYYFVGAFSASSEVRSFPCRTHAQHTLMHFLTFSIPYFYYYPSAMSFGIFSFLYSPRWYSLIIFHLVIPPPYGTNSFCHDLVILWRPSVPFGFLRLPFLSRSWPLYLFFSRLPGMFTPFHPIFMFNVR